MQNRASGLVTTSAWNLLLLLVSVSPSPPQTRGRRCRSRAHLFFLRRRLPTLPVAGSGSRESRVGGRMEREVGEGWRPWAAVPRIAAGAISVPVVVGFVAL